MSPTLDSSSPPALDEDGDDRETAGSTARRSSTQGDDDAMEDDIEEGTTKATPTSSNATNTSDNRQLAKSSMITTLRSIEKPVNDDIMNAEGSDKPRSIKRRRCLYGMCCLFFMLVVAGIMLYIFYFFTNEVDLNEIAMCGNCHCILEDNDTGGSDGGATAKSCPALPPLYVSSYVGDENDEDDVVVKLGSLSLAERYPKLITWLKAQKPINPYTLNEDKCNPYENRDSCQTEPSQNTALLQLQDTAVCAIHYEHYKNTDYVNDDVVVVNDGDEINDTGNSNGTIMLNGTDETSDNNFNSSATTISLAAATSPTNDCNNNNNNNGHNMYTLRTYASYEDAVMNGGFVTHVGSCGVCSTLQDLAVYMSNSDLTSEGEYCAKQGLISFDTSMQCYIDLGFTQSCAYIWATNSANTATECFTECALNSDLVDDLSSTTDSIKDIINFNDNDDSKEDDRSSNNGGGGNNGGGMGNDNNGPPPTCKLNDCLQCDEDKSGQIFQQYAGRTRRRSGLLSAIVRPCTSLTSATSRVYNFKKLMDGVVNATKTTIAIMENEDEESAVESGNGSSSSLCP